MINIDNHPIGMSHLSSQINSNDIYRIVTSRHSRNRKEYLANAGGVMTAGDRADELGHFDLNDNLNMTEHHIALPDNIIMATTDCRNNRKGFNLTNLSIKISEVHEPGPKQKTERNHKTSLTNLQSYLMQRGINYDTTSNALS
jgi:hypothetical protein